MNRTSRSIQPRIARLNAITAHISPYAGGLAQETHHFVAELNAEAARRGTGVKYIALANRIEARGAIERASRQSTLGGWFLSCAIAAGFLNGEEAVLRLGNPVHRKKLRKRAKTKAGIRENHQAEQWLRNRTRARRAAEAGDAYIGPASIVPAKWPHAWIDGVYMPILNPHRPREATYLD